MSLNPPSIAKTPLENQLLELVDKIAGEKGFRTVDVDCRVGGHSLVRVFIERFSEGKSSPAMIADCVTVSHLLSAVLDTAEWFKGPYELEVSSAGLDRRLRLLSDFESAVGKDLKLKLFERLMGKGSNVTGTLLNVQGEGIQVKVDKEEFQIPLSKVKQANVVWQQQQEGK